MLFLLMLVVIAIACAVPAWAQTVSGFRLGANVATLSGTFADDADPERHLGLVAGSFTRFPLTAAVGVQLEVLYSQKGARFASSEIDPAERTLLATYLEVPVLLAYTPFPFSRSTPTLLAGAAVGFEISERIRERAGDLEQSQESDALLSPDLGLLVGADVPFSLGALDLVFGARYTHGLRDLVNQDTATRPDAEAFTRTFALTVGLLF